MKTVNHYKVTILQSGESFFEKEVIKVALENERFIILDTDRFDKISKDKSYICSQLGKHSITVRTTETGYFKDHKEFGNGVFYSLYTDKNKRPTTIQKEIKEVLDEKYGYLATIDLSFIK